MKSKNIIINIVITLILILGLSYAFFNYTRTSKENSRLVTGDIYMHYKEINELTNYKVFPETKEEGLDNEYFEFKVSGKNTSNKDIYYAISLAYGDDLSPKTRYHDEDIVFYLTEVVDGEEKVLIDSVRYTNYNNAKIWVATIDAGTKNEIEYVYRLRMWISETVLISDSDESATYTTGEYYNSYANVRVNVEGNLNENDINMILNSNDDNIINGKRAIDVDTYGKENDVLVLDVSSDNSDIKFMYQDSKGNAVSELTESLSINYKSYLDEVITTRVILVPENDANTKANIYFKLTRNGVVVEEQVKTVLVYGTNYCLNNGFDKLGECILVSEKLSNSVSDAKFAITNKGTPDFSKTAPIMTYIQVVDEDVTNALVDNVGQEFYVSKNLIFDSVTGKYSLGEPMSLVTLDESGKYEDYYTLGPRNYGTENLEKAYKIKSVSVDGLKTTLTKADRYTYSTAEVIDASEIGLYKTQDDDGDSYYYRGNVINNNVKFAGFDWKIIRVNGDGSIRMITTNNVSKTIFNSRYEDPTYVGYTYNTNFSTIETESSAVSYCGPKTAVQYYFGASYKYDDEKKLYTLMATEEKPLKSGTIADMTTDNNISNGYMYTCFSTEENGTCEVLKKFTQPYDGSSTCFMVNFVAHSSIDYPGTIGNDYDSAIKTIIDNWYSTNLKNYSQYLEDTYFCNDRSLKDTKYNSGYKLDQQTNYGAYTRNVTNKNPSVLCENKNDRYTVSNTNGNNWLDYPVGLISADEVMLAGGVYNLMNEKYYLRNNSYFWVGTPCYFRPAHITAHAWIVYSSGVIAPGSYASSYYVRPVINLKSNVKIVSGDGSLDNPYELTLS